jgi:hypothetical protein
MNEEKLRRLILKRLDESVKPDKIVFEICEKTNMHWTDAEKLVQQVAAERGKKVSGKELAVSVTWSTVMLVTGLVLVFGSILAYWLMYRAVTFTMFEVMNATNALLYSINFGPILFSVAMIGVAMIAGGLLGARHLWDDTRSKGGKHEK